jgi:prevent-host-death family protein
MRLMSATEASRNFAAVLDAAERGETIVITRGGRRIAVLGPAPKATGAAVKDLLRRHTLDSHWGEDLSGVRELLTTEDRWPAA